MTLTPAMRIPHLFILLFQLGSWVRFGSGLDISHRDLELANIVNGAQHFSKPSHFIQNSERRVRMHRATAKDLNQTTMP
ncbi:hypothetical protein M8J75_007708 [Diaphorina citri]|nr:hypothetical protein M8J75_007708 [Diaphorina citri]